ncbi:MAG: hypothetical protein WKF31_02485 [Thermoleophilaceae bacterium]
MVEVELFDDPALADVDEEEGPVELAAHDGAPSVRAEVHVVDAEAPDAERLLELPRLRIAEVEALEALGDDDRRSSVRREVEVVRVVDRDGAAPWASRSRDRSGSASSPGCCSRRRSLMSRDGVTWWGRSPTGKVSTTFAASGSITLTVSLSEFGT